MRASLIVSPPFEATDFIVLDETGRSRRRLRMTSAGGVNFLLDLADAVLLRHGDGLKLEDGRIIEVRALPEPLYRITGRDPRHLLALAWQIGNRHLPAHILPAEIRIRRDHVIRDMLTGLGATVEDIEAPFDPEPGAYSGHHSAGDGQPGHHHSEEPTGTAVHHHGP